MPLVSARQYARHRGVSHAAVQKALRQGRIETTPDGRIDVAQADQDWARNTGPAAPARKALANPGMPSGPSFAQSRAVRELYLARLSKLDFEERSGQLVRVAEVEHTVAVVCQTVRDHLLALPDRIAGSLAAETDAIQVRGMLRHEIWEALRELSRSLEARGIGGAGPEVPDEEQQGV